jgi:hypothetical protein
MSHRDVSGEVRLASGDSLGHSVNLAVAHVATARPFARTMIAISARRQSCAALIG